MTSARAFSSYELVFNNVAKTTYFLPAMGLLGRPPRGGAPGGLGTSGGAPDGGDSVHDNRVLTHHGVLGFIRGASGWLLDDVATDPGRMGEPC